MQLPIYVISLARVTERRASIVDRLNKAGVKYEIVDAVDGCTLDMSTVMHRIKNPNILKNVTACFLSHYNLWARIVDERIPHAIILEDDAAWDHDFLRWQMNCRR